MLMGSTTHILWVVRNGFLSDNYNVSLFSKIFWDSLTFLDPLAAILLILKPRIGVYLTLFIILFDIVHNNLLHFDELYMNEIELKEWIVKYWMIMGQILYGLFVILTFRSNLNDINCKIRNQKF